MDVHFKKSDTGPLAAARFKAPVKSRIPAMNIVCSGPENPSGQSREKLILNGKEITSISKVVFGFTNVSHIQVLELSMNLITSIPECIASLTSLKKLDLSQNYIHSLGSSLSKVKTLVRLNLAKNRLSKIASSDIYQLYFAKTVIVSQNVIMEVTQNIRHLSNLKVLYIDGNPFRTLPVTLKDLRSLKELKLEWPEYLSPPRFPSITCQDFIQKSVEESSHTGIRLNSWISWEEFSAFLGELEISNKATSFTLANLHDRFSLAPKADVKECLARAVRAGHQGIAATLLEDPNCKEIRQDELEQMLAITLRWPTSTVALKILQLGASCNTRVNKRHESMLHICADIMSNEIIEALSDYGCNATIVDAFGNTPLHRLFQKKNERDYFVQNKLATDYDSGQGHFQPILNRNRQEDSKGSLPTKNVLNHSGMGKDNDQYYSDFYKKMVEVAVQLVHVGVDPNVYNSAGMCAWHSLVAHERYLPFKLLRMCDMTGTNKIDWSLGPLGGELPILHFTAKCTDWRFFVEYLEGKSKVNLLELDSQLRLPLQVISQPFIPLKFKIYLRHLKSDFSIFLRFQKNSENSQKARLKRKASLMRRALGDDRILSQKSRCTNESSAFKKFNPLLQISTQVHKLASFPTEICQSSCQPSANIVRCIKPKSGFYKFSAPQSIDRSQDRMADFGPASLNGHVSRSIGTVEATDDDRSLFQSKGTNQWLEGIVSNIKIKQMIGKPATVHQISGSTIIKENLNDKPFTVRAESKVIKATADGNFSAKGISLINFQQNSDISENANINKSRKMEVSLNMSQLNSVRSQKATQVVTGDQIVPRLLKIVTKLLLRDLITLRYTVPKLSSVFEHGRTAGSQNLLHLLIGLQIFFMKLKSVLASMSGFLQQGLYEAFIQAIKQELMHEDCLLRIKNLLQENFLDKKQRIISQRRYAEMATAEDILAIIYLMFGRDFTVKLKVTSSAKAPSRLSAQSGKINFGPGGSNLLFRALVMAPKKLTETTDNKRFMNQETSQQKQNDEQSLESSDDSLDLNMKKIVKPYHAAYKMNISSLKERMNNSELETHQLPMKRFINNHDKNLKCLENQIVSIRTNMTSKIAPLVSTTTKMDNAGHSNQRKDDSDWQADSCLAFRRARPKLL